MSVIDYQTFLTLMADHKTEELVAGLDFLESFLKKINFFKNFLFFSTKFAVKIRYFLFLA